MLNKYLKFDFISKNGSKIYQADNFFSHEFYDELDKSFPELDEKNFKKKNDDKFSLEINTEIFEKISNHNNALLKFKNLINSNNFKKKLYWKIFYKLILSNKDNIFKTLKFFRPPKFESGHKSIFDIIYSKIKVDCEFSYIKNKGKIVPHVDSQKELFTFVIYFPKFDNNNKLSQIEKNYGTSFWNSKIKNNTNKHLTDDLEEKEFKNNSQIHFQSKYIKNKCCGFVRNNRSWHTVEPLDISPDYVRRSININYILIN